MYTIPPYVVGAGIDDPRIRFVWDDTRASEDFRFVPYAWMARIGALSVAAQIALGIGLYEWIVWRFHRMDRDPLPMQIAAAAWCASVDPARVDYIELERENWIGPVRGPLWCAVTWMLPMVFEGRDAPGELESGAAYLLQLCMHVLPDNSAFLAWLDAAIGRLEQAVPAVPEDPFEDLFDSAVASGRTEAVDRAVLDPGYRIDPGLPLPPPERMLLEPGDGNPLLLTPAQAEARHRRGPFVADH